MATSRLVHPVFRLSTAIFQGAVFATAWQDSPASCTGTVNQVRTYPLNQCLPTTWFGDTADYLYTCDGKDLVMNYYFEATTCQAGMSIATTVPVGQCTKIRGEGALATVVTCNKTHTIWHRWSAMPPEPTNLSCGGVSKDGGLPVECQVDPKLVDSVSIEVSLPSANPFLSFSALPDASGLVRAQVPGLNRSSRYEVRARSHRLGEEEGNPDSWSYLTKESVFCSTTANRDTKTTKSSPVTNSKTRWLEVFRIAATNISGVVMPDFLEQHNVGDLIGVMSMVLAYTTDRGNFPLTRYCAELLDVELPGVITSNMDGKPRTGPFADYLSCNSGDCVCMHQVDRTIARLPAKQIKDLCYGNPAIGSLNNTCKCSNASLAQSNSYIGYCPVHMPLYSVESVVQDPSAVPADYPPPCKPSPVGGFYSFPAAGRCSPGRQVGEEGCSWQRLPLAYTVYTGDLVRRGFNTSYTQYTNKINRTTGKLISSEIDYATTVANLDVIRKAFDELNPLACGPLAEQSSASVLWV